MFCADHACSACASIHHTANSSWHVVKFGSDRQPEVDSVLLEALPDVVKSNVLKVKSAERHILGRTAFVDSLKAADSRLSYSFTLYTAFWRYISILRRHVLLYLPNENRVRNSLPYSSAYVFRNLRTLRTNDLTNGWADWTYNNAVGKWLWLRYGCPPERQH